MASVASHTASGPHARPSRCWPPSATRRCCAWKRSRASFPASRSSAKAEYFNPGGSVKDRAALNMILDGERSGKLNPSRVILDATSGNTGIAYAMIARQPRLQGQAVPARATPPSSASASCRPTARRWCSATPAEGSDGAIRLCRQIYMADPDRYFYPDQYNNPANWKAHYEHTGPEIIEQTGGTHHALRGRHGHQRHVHRRHPPPAPRPAGREVLSRRSLRAVSTAWKGLKHMPTAIVPGIYDEKLADGNLWIETEDAYRMVRRLAREEGLLVGISSGCNVHAATLLARDLAARGESATIVTVLCDSAEKYLSEQFWDEA